MENPRARAPRVALASALVALAARGALVSPLGALPGCAAGPTTSTTTLTAAGAAASALPDDPTIADGVGSALEDDASIPPGLDVRVERHVVTLLGEVDSLRALDRAPLLAENVDGVRAVVNRLSLAPSVRTDGTIGAEVERALADDVVTRASAIRATVHDGVVRLEGDVAIPAERAAAEDVARGVAGVRRVDDALTLGAPRRSDDALKMLVERRITRDPRIAPQLVSVAVVRGVAILSGAVGTPGERAAAIADASIEGLAGLEPGRLVVQPSLRGMIPQSAPPPRDDAIRGAILEAFAQDPRVAGLGIGAEVHAGEARLFGAVATARVRVAAEDDARYAYGVSRVVDAIEVRPLAPLTDAELAARATAALRSDPALAREPIDVRAFEGDVLLEGTVATPAERARASDRVAQIAGVRSIRVQIGVRAP